MTSEGDAEYEGGDFRYPLPKTLFVFVPRSQKSAITAKHQSEAGLHQAYSPIAQIVRFPGAVGDALLAEQRLCDHPVCATGSVRIECTKCFAQTLAPLF